MWNKLWLARILTGIACVIFHIVVGATDLAVALLLYGLGACLNLLVLWKNNWLMPVCIKINNPQYEDHVKTITLGHCLMTKETHFNFLADRFGWVSSTGEINRILSSAGDILQFAMIAYFIVWSIRAFS